MLRIKTSRQSGFTLVELLIASALSVLLIGGAVVLATSGTSAAAGSERLARAQENLRFVSNFLIQELRNTGSFPFSGLDLSNDLFLDVPDDGSSVLVKYEAARNCVTQSTASTNGVATNRYFLSNNQLVCDGGQGLTGVLLEGISNLSFAPISNPVSGEPIGIRVQLQLEDDPFPDLVYTFSIAFRNLVLREADAMNATP